VNAFLTATLALFALAPQHTPAEDARFEVEIVEDEGELFCTVAADNALWIDVLTEIAEEAKLELDGVGKDVEKLLLTADLRRRPLRQALAYIGGSLGLRFDVRQDTILVRDADAATWNRDELRDAAVAGYLRVVRDFPNHELAAEAHLSRAEIEELRGRSAGARASYEALVQQNPDSVLVPQALYRSAQLFQQEGEWRSAVEKYSRLLRSERATGYELSARLELAWCVARLGESERALYMVDALEVMQPARDDSESLRRGQIRVRALAALGDGARALELLNDVEQRFGAGADKRESLELRALACEAARTPIDASRAWLSLSRMVEGSARSSALTKACRAALDGHDELSALFIAEAAREEGFDLGDLEHEARTRLDIEGFAGSEASPLVRLAQAEALLASEPSSRALSMLNEIQATSPALDEPTRVRLEIAVGRALARSVSTDEALAHFRTVIPGIASADERKRIYVVAAELLERESRFDESIEALRGRL
jgi:tetratricopeptide (TPR) repeat protein